VEKIIFSSTCATYGEPAVVPITEDQPQSPVNPYGASKLMVERMLQDFGLAHGLRSAALRYFNAAGADPEGDTGEDHDPETHLIPLVLDAAAGRRPQITVFGNDYDTPDGTCIRDYIHVTDLADAHLRALERLNDRGGFSAYNLGNGAGYSVQEVIDTSMAVTGRRIPVTIGSRRPGDPPRLVGDASRAKRELAWEPRYADLPTIIETAWRWATRVR
jgi:UDP-glucose-4-epimerase GalE